MADAARRRLRDELLDVKMWRAKAWLRLILPVPVFLKRFDAPLGFQLWHLDSSWKRAWERTARKYSRFEVDGCCDRKNDDLH